MATKKELNYIHKRTAEIINDLMIAYNKNTVYDLFCSDLMISRHLNNANIYCSDINNIKVNILKAYKYNNIQEIVDILNIVVKSYLDNPDNEDIVSLMETLNELYSKANVENLEFRTIQDIVNYNEDMHIERFCKNDLINKLAYENIHISCESYDNVNILENSIVFCYAPFRKTNILEDKFNHKEFMCWIDNIIKDRADIILLVLTYEQLDNKMTLLDDFNSENKKKKLKLYISNNISIDDSIDDDF